MSKNNKEVMTALEIAKDLIKNSGIPVEELVAKMLNDNAEIQKQLKAEAEIVEINKTLSEKEKQDLLTGCVMHSAGVLHRGFHAAGAMTAIKTRVRFDDGEYDIHFGRVLIIDPKSLS